MRRSSVIDSRPSVLHRCAAIRTPPPASSGITASAAAAWTTIALTECATASCSSRASRARSSATASRAPASRRRSSSAASARELLRLAVQRPGEPAGQPRSRRQRRHHAELGVLVDATVAQRRGREREQAAGDGGPGRP